MLIKVKIQTDEKGKYYIHKKKKIHIAKKCIKLLPKKEAFNVYVNDDGAKYYHIGYKKVYLGNDIEVSKNVCDDLEKVLTHKKRKLDKVIVDSIEEIKSRKKRKKQVKKTKTKEAVESIKGVIKKDLLDVKKSEDFANKKPQKASYAQTRARLIQAEVKVQQVKNDAVNKGFTPEQKRRAVSEVKQLITSTPEQREMKDYQSTLPALEALYGSSVDWRFDKSGIPVFPLVEEKIKKVEADELLRVREKERELDLNDWLSKNPQPVYEKPKKTIGGFFKSMFGGKPKEEEEDKDEDDDDDDDDDDDEDEDEDEESVAESVVSKSTPISSLKPISMKETAIQESTDELKARLLKIQDYLDTDITDLKRYKDHISLLEDKTEAEKLKVLKVGTAINKVRKAFIKEYWLYGSELIPSYIQTEKNNPFETKILRKFGVKKEVEGIMKNIHKVEIQASQPKTIDSYEQLNMLVDTAKHKPEFRQSVIDKSIDRHIEQLERMTSQLEKGTGTGNVFGDRVEYATTILKRFRKEDGDADFKIPTKLYDYMKDGGKTGYGKNSPLLKTGIFKKEISSWGTGSILSGLEEDENYYGKKAFNHDLYDGIKKDVRSKFSNTKSTLLSDEMFDRAYFGDDLDKDKPPSLLKTKKSASHGLDVLTGKTEVGTTIPHHIVVDFDADEAHYNMGNQAQQEQEPLLQEGKATPESSVIDDEASQVSYESYTLTNSSYERDDE